MIFSFGPRGLITYGVFAVKGFSVYGLGATLFSEALTSFPIAYLTLRPILAGIDSNIETMARSLGASRARVFRTVTLPLCVPGIANAFLLLFAASLADFATPLILAGNSFPVLPTQAYLQITGLFDLRGGAALSFILLVPALIVFLLQRFWVSRRYYVTITGKGAGQMPFDSVSRGARFALLGVVVAITLVVVYFYALLLYASMVVALGANHALTLQHYRVIFTDGWKAIADTLIIAGLSMPLGGLYGIVLGYLVTRHRFPGRRTMEAVSMMNYALPGTIVGIAYLIAFNDPPFVLTGTALIIIACYIFRYGPTGIRATVALLQQIDPSLEEASQGLGARSGTTFRRITLPLIMPAFFAGLGVVFVRSMTAISATIFLVSSSWTPARSAWRARMSRTFPQIGATSASYSRITRYSRICRYSRTLRTDFACAASQVTPSHEPLETSWRSWASRDTSSNFRRSYPAANSNGWRSRGRPSFVRAFSCSTNRCRISTRSSACRCGARYAPYSSGCRLPRST